MICPNCQHPLEHPVAKMRAKRRREGRCLQCGDPLVPDPRYARCLKCRLKNQEYWRSRRQRPTK